MFKKQFAAIILAILMMATLGNAEEIGGINMPASMQTGQTQLMLNGAGVRTKFFMDLYVGGLYLKEKSQDAKAVIETDEPMAIKLHIVSSMITSKKMEKATSGNIEAIKVQIEEFISVFKEEIKEGDIFDLIYVPEKGVEVSKNNESRSIVKGFPFKKAMFGIWQIHNKGVFLQEGYVRHMAF